MAEVRVRNDELHTMRAATRELTQLVDALERRELEKLVLTQRGRMRAIVVSVERYSALQECEESMRSISEPSPA